jgi:hypothetical protein
MPYRDVVAVARLLLAERLRRLIAQYGWAARLSLGLVIGPTAWLVSVVVSRLIGVSAAGRVESGMNLFWMSWVITGVLAGRDLFWHPRLEGLVRLPISFARLYLIGLFVGLLSFPLLLMLCVFVLSAMENGSTCSGLLLTPVGLGLLALSARSGVSLIRAAVFFHKGLGNRAHAIAWTSAVVVAGCAAGPLVCGPLGFLCPGFHFARLLLCRTPLLSLLIMSIQAAALVAADYSVQWASLYSGVAGPIASGVSRKSRCRLLPVQRAPYAVLWWISMLGWIRNRNVLLLFLWGIGYGFGYTYLAEPHSREYFIMFCFMVLLFLCHLRGNILGVDHKAAWIFFMIPRPVQGVFRAKYRALSTLQFTMAAAVLLPAALRRTPGMTSALDWAVVLSYVFCSLLLTEILGSICSITHPEAMERTSAYAGGMTLGAIVVGIVHAALLAFYLFGTDEAFLSMSAAGTWMSLAGIPALLWAIRSAVMPRWIRNAALRDTETLLFKLTC